MHKQLFEKKALLHHMSHNYKEALTISLNSLWLMEVRRKKEKR